MIVEALLVVLVGLSIAYLVLLFAPGPQTYTGKAVNDLQQKVPKQVLSSSDFKWDASPCAIRFGIFVEHAPRTLTKADCVVKSPSTELQVFQPNCENYEFSTCSCTDSSCNNCAITNSYLTKLLWVQNKLELWAAGYTNENDKPYVPALLKVYTEKDDASKYMESIPLPTIPLQRWTIITIVKQGRRFDVYYGEELVASKITTYVPSPPDNGNWLAGSPLWKGQIGFFKGVKQSWTKDDVKQDVKSLVNTRGIPFYIDQPPFEMKNLLEIPSCPFGNCNPMPLVRPSNPFYVYDTKLN